MSKNKSSFNLDLTLRLPGGLTRRGDLNLLLLADPGTAKSQVLKFVEHVEHRAVYTSGNGISIAGLTAPVIRNPSTRNFMIEGAAMITSISYRLFYLVLI